MSTLTRKPIIGCTTYRKTAAQTPPISLMALMPSYVEAIKAAGGIPLLIPLGLSDDDLCAIFEQLDGLLLPGGGDVAAHYYGSHHPELISDVDDDRDRVELFLARLAVTQRKPLLAICRGHQLLNVALGGTLYEDVNLQYPEALRHDNYNLFPRNHLAHHVSVIPGSRLAALFNGAAEVRVNSLHHQGVRDLAPELTAVATAPDGLIEGVELPDHPFAVGVQWHPENLVDDDPLMLELFKGLTAAALNGKQ
jgi:putative glutamine amidotransferase